MTYRVILTPGAIGDIESIYLFIAQNAGPMTADDVLRGLEKQIDRLSTVPERGNVPKELSAMGRADFRELHFKPYRVFYRVSKSTVEVMAVMDGRRDMSTLLRQRLTR